MQRITIGRANGGLQKPERIEIDGRELLRLDTQWNQDGPVLGVLVFALNQLPDRQLDSLAALANADAEEPASAD